MNERNQHLIANAIKIINWCEANVPEELFGEKELWRSECDAFKLTRGVIACHFFEIDKTTRYLEIYKDHTLFYLNGAVDDDGIVWYGNEPIKSLNTVLTDGDPCFEVIEYFIKNWESIKSKILENIDAELDKKRKEEDFENLIINFNP